MYKWQPTLMDDNVGPMLADEHSNAYCPPQRQHLSINKQHVHFQKHIINPFATAPRFVTGLGVYTREHSGCRARRTLSRHRFVNYIIINTAHYKTCLHNCYICCLGLVQIQYTRRATTQHKLLKYDALPGNKHRVQTPIFHPAASHTHIERIIFKLIS